MIFSDDSRFSFVELLLSIIELLLGPNKNKCDWLGEALKTWMRAITAQVGKLETCPKLLAPGAALWSSSHEQIPFSPTLRMKPEEFTVAAELN